MSLAQENAASGTTRVDLADRIELRRFVGRELLLWLWMESELFDATLSTKEHGDFALWVEGRLVLDSGHESTVIKGGTPGHHREAKESLLRGKSPARAGLHLTFGDHDCALTLRGDTLAIAGLAAPRREKSEAVATEGVAPLDAAPARRKAKPKDDERAAEEAAFREHERFYDRMAFARAVEELLEALYRDFLALRLSPTWDSTVVPALEAWATGDEVDVERYRAAKDRGLSRTRRR